MPMPLEEALAASNLQHGQLFGQESAMASGSREAFLLRKQSIWPPHLKFDKTTAVNIARIAMPLHT